MLLFSHRIRNCKLLTTFLWNSTLRNWTFHSSHLHGLQNPTLYPTHLFPHSTSVPVPIPQAHCTNTLGILVHFSQRICPRSTQWKRRLARCLPFSHVSSQGSPKKYFSPCTLQRYVIISKPVCRHGHPTSYVTLLSCKRFNNYHDIFCRLFQVSIWPGLKQAWPIFVSDQRQFILFPHLYNSI